MKERLLSIKRLYGAGARESGAGGALTVDEKWQELFGEPLDKSQATETLEAADGTRVYLMPNGFAVAVFDDDYQCIYPPAKAAEVMKET